MTVTSMTTPTVVKMTGVVEASEGGEGRDLRRNAPGPDHKSLESPRLHSLDILQHDILILKQHENLVVMRYGDTFRKTGRIP
jgi:hypothetical protein